MSVHKLTYQVEAGGAGRRLDQFLAAGKTLSRRQARRLIEAGAVYIDGKRVRVASRRVPLDAWIEVYLETTPAEPPLGLGAGDILFEDDFLIAVDKPTGMASQATVSDAVHDLFAQLRRFLAERDGRPPYLALHHRLDRGTSGVMLFAKHRRANPGLAAAFKEHRVRKVYHALSAVTGERPPDAAWTVRNRLSAPRDQGGGARCVEAVEEGGRDAETELRPLRYLSPRGDSRGGETFPGAVWTEALPKTGRTHQIRVHLADSGLPVLGDKLYGRAGTSIPAPRLMLHALGLTLEHPLTREPLAIESPLPEDFRRQVDLLDGVSSDPETVPDVLAALEDA